jgi:hypothetical protein
MRFSRQLFWSKRHDFLEPSGSQCMVGETDLGWGLLAFQPQLQGRDEPNEQGPIQNTKIAENPVPTDVATQG